MPSSVSVNAADLTLAPSTPGLPGNTAYTVRLASTIADTSGRVLGNAYSTSFTTAPQAWNVTSTIVASVAASTPGGAQPAAEADSLGNVTAVWHYNNPQANGTNPDTLFMARWDGHSGTWGLGGNFYEAAGASYIGNLSVLAGPNGDAYAIWMEGSVLKFARYSAAQNTWAFQQVSITPAGMIPDPPGPLVADSNGNLTVLTTGGTVGQIELFETTYNGASGTWSAPAEILIPSTFSGTTSINTQGMAVDGQGNITAAWYQSATLSEPLVATHYDAASGTWTPFQQLDPNVSTGLYNTVSMALDPTGVVTIAWTHSGGLAGNPNAEVSRFDPSTATWSASTQLDSGTGALGAGTPAVAVDPAGYATVAWFQYEGVFASRFNPTTQSWTAAQRVSAAGATPNSPAAVTADSAGNVTVVYVDGFSHRAVAIEYEVSGGQWLAPVMIDTPSGGATPIFSNLPVTVSDPSGTVTAVWYAEDSAHGPSLDLLTANQFK